MCVCNGVRVGVAPSCTSYVCLCDIHTRLRSQARREHLRDHLAAKSAEDADLRLAVESGERGGQMEERERER